MPHVNITSDESIEAENYQWDSGQCGQDATIGFLVAHGNQDHQLNSLLQKSVTSKKHLSDVQTHSVPCLVLLHSIMQQVSHHVTYHKRADAVSQQGILLPQGHMRWEGKALGEGVQPGNLCRSEVAKPQGPYLLLCQMASMFTILRGVPFTAWESCFVT